MPGRRLFAVRTWFVVCMCCGISTNGIPQYTQILMQQFLAHIDQLLVFATCSNLMSCDLHFVYSGVDRRPRMLLGGIFRVALEIAWQATAGTVGTLGRAQFQMRREVRCQAIKKNERQDSRINSRDGSKVPGHWCHSAALKIQ